MSKTSSKSVKALSRAKMLEIWKSEVDKKWGTKCEICGSENTIQRHHFFNETTYPELRYNVFNGVPICRSCHFRIERKKELLLVIQIIKQRGNKWLNKLLNKI